MFAAACSGRAAMSCFYDGRMISILSMYSMHALKACASWRRRSVVPSAKKGYTELEDGSKHRADMVYMHGGFF
jgi:hypothetical protein